MVATWRHVWTDPLLTIDQVAEYCNVSRRLVQNWIYAGDLDRAVKLGGRTIRVRQSALDEFLDRPYDPRTPRPVGGLRVTAVDAAMADLVVPLGPPPRLLLPELPPR